MSVGPFPPKSCSAFALVVALGVNACCHVNRLAELQTKIGAVEYSARMDADPQAVFTRQINTQARAFMGPIATASRTTTFFNESLEALGAAAIAGSLAERLPAAFQRKTGWTPSVEGVPGAALFEVVVRNVSFVAADPISPVSVFWSVTVSLTDRSTAQIVWRDCLEWTSAGDFGSMEDLARKDQVASRAVAAGLAQKAAGRLATHVARDARPRP